MIQEPELPEEWVRIETIDAHAGGEPLRIITTGAPNLQSGSILQQREELRSNYDSFRQTVIYEPRGHRDMYGAVLVESDSPSGDIGVLFLHNDGYSTMCGHGIIALGTVLPETNMVVTQSGSEIVMDTPAGPVSTRPQYTQNQVQAVSFENVPSFVYASDSQISVSGLGSIQYDIAYGGAYYAYVDVRQMDLDIAPSDSDELARTGMAIKHAVADAVSIDHPGADDLGYLYGTIFYEQVAGPSCDIRNVCIFADGQVDRSPTGTGISGHVARRVATGDLSGGDSITVESIVGTTFEGRASQTTTVDGHAAVVPEITGSAHITGRHEFVIDPDDPLRDGFLLQ